MELSLENVRKTFGEKVALDIDTYVVHDGEIVGLVGNNGAGKTTMFRVIQISYVPTAELPASVASPRLTVRTGRFRPEPMLTLVS